MQMDIYAREKNGNREIRFPILPEEIMDESGNAVFVSSEIMNLGEVATPSGTELSIYSWKSEFPGEGRQRDPLIRGTWQAPKSFDSILKDWKGSETIINLLVTGYSLNVDVYVKEYKPVYSGAFGDISYEIVFVEARDIVITTSKVEETAPQRPTTQTKSYTIKSGDTLWGIARQFYGTGTKWKTIYDANKDIIEKTAKKYGRSSSDNGHWIYPGVTLTIPDASASSGSSGGSGGSSGTSSASTSSTSASEASTAEKNAAYTSQRNAGVSGMVNKIIDSQSPQASSTIMN